MDSVEFKRLVMRRLTNLVYSTVQKKELPIEVARRLLDEAVGEWPDAEEQKILDKLVGWE